MLKKNILFILLCLSSNINAQNIPISIEWDGLAPVTFGADTLHLLHFNDANYGGIYSELPTYIYQKELGNISPRDVHFDISISNIKSSPFLPDNKNFSSTKLLEDTVQYEYYVSQTAGESILEIHVLPAFKGAGENIQLASSFSINIQQTSKLKTKTTEIIEPFSGSSVLKNGKWVKIAIEESGMYKLTYSDIAAMGLDAKNVRIFGNGGHMLDIIFTDRKHDDLVENAVYLVSSDGIFKEGDYILFYGMGTDKWEYEYNTSSQKSEYVHTQHDFDDKTYYFLTSDAGTGKRVEKQPVINANINTNVSSFDDYRYIEPEEKNLLHSGSQWFSQDLEPNESVQYSFNFPNIITTEPTLIEANVVARTTSSSSSFNALYNSSLVGSVTLKPSSEKTNGQFALMGNTYGVFLPTADIISMDIKYLSTESNGTGWIDYLRVIARRSLKMEDDQMSFRDSKSIGTTNVSRFSISNAQDNLMVFDVTDWVNPVQIQGTVTNDTYQFDAFTQDLNEYIAFNPNGDFPKPEVIGVVSNQNLHATTATDYIIFTPEIFKNQAKRLANLHRANGLTVIVIEPQEVYNEFSSGQRDITAFRWFSKMLYNRFIGDNNLKYVLFFGDATYDARPSQKDNSNNPNYLMTYESVNSLHRSYTYASDDYFGLLDDDEGSAGDSDRIDIGIGRFPVSTVQQATQVVDKIEFYMGNSNQTPWKNSVLFIADDEDGNIHARDANNIANKVMQSNPEMVVKKLLIDAYQQVTLSSGPSYPDTNTLIDKNIEDGVLILNYSGHGGKVGLAAEKIVTMNGIQNYTNLNNLPLWLTATCEFSRYDLKDETTAGEEVLLNPNGGGIGLFTTTRLVYSNANYVINSKFYDYAFQVSNNGQRNRLGDIFRLTKKATATQENKRKFSLLGDPALELNYPTYKVITSEFNGVPVGEGVDTLKALSDITISGYIETFNGEVASNFNGLLYPIVYDKILNKTTLANDGGNKMSFKAWESILFSGKCEVVDGEFTFTFKVPKDINYIDGLGRIAYYGTSEQHEAQGCFEDFIVGGYNDDHDTDEDGPDVDIYLNTKNFENGDRVNPSPLLIAEISDLSGINKAGSSIGHDIIAVLDNGPTTTVILNDNFESELGDFTKGVLEYKFNDLLEGEHTLFFRIWDNHNNSSVKTLTFYVENDIKPNIYDLLVSPNPAYEDDSNVSFTFSHNRPETVLDINIEIFDLKGSRIAYIQSPPIPSPDNHINPIEWDLTTESGNRVSKGLYLYRVTMTDSDTNITSRGAVKTLLVQ